MKRIVPLIILLIITAAAIFYIASLQKKPPSTAIELSGTIETTDVDMSFQVPGRIVFIGPQEGDHVKKGELLGKLDDKDINQQIEQAKAQVVSIRSQLPQLETKIQTSSEQQRKQLSQARAQIEEAKLRWISLSKGSRDEDIARAKFAVDQAKHAADNAKREYERARALFKEGAMPGQQRDALETVYFTSVDQYRQSKENYRLLLNGPRKEDIAAAAQKVKQAEAAYELVKTQSLQTRQLEQQRAIFEAQIAQAREAIKQAKISREHTKLYSPITGVILTRPREPGEVVSASTPVLTMANIEKVYLKAYVGERDLGKVKLGQKVRISTDSFPGKNYEGAIYYISSEAEFTPKNLQTKEDRVKLVFRIKVEVPNPNQELKPGMIADGIIDIASFTEKK
jgi:HlyD family secretion protein